MATVLPPGGREVDRGASTSVPCRCAGVFTRSMENKGEGHAKRLDRCLSSKAYGVREDNHEFPPTRHKQRLQHGKQP